MPVLLRIALSVKGLCWSTTTRWKPSRIKLLNMQGFVLGNFSAFPSTLTFRPLRSACSNIFGKWITLRNLSQSKTSLCTMASTFGHRVQDETPTVSSRTIYPRIEPYHKDYLQVSETHKVYYEVSGNRNGLPICFVHGGPGGGTVPAHRGFFDPRVYKIVLFDQRGCGKSQPFACLEENTTWDLVEDMERVREAAGIESWILFGGSWGSTLSIAYAQEHPHRVLGMILRGIFLSRKQELDWLYGPKGAAMLYPEAYEAFLSGLPKEMRDSEDIIETFYTILSQEENNEERRVAANAWSNWERSLCSFQKTDGPAEIDNDYSDDENLAFARLEAHYFVNKGFLLDDGYLVKETQMQKIRYIKTSIVQGRWDAVCPRKSAYDLARMFDPRCVDVVLVDNAGHSTFEPGIEAALLDATDAFGKEFGSSSNSIGFPIGSKVLDGACEVGRPRVECFASHFEFKPQSLGLELMAVKATNVYVCYRGMRERVFLGAGTIF